MIRKNSWKTRVILFVLALHAGTVAAQKVPPRPRPQISAPQPRRGPIRPDQEAKSPLIILSHNQMRL